MPFVPGQDRYFASKLDPKVLSAWITDVRNSLVAMNAVNPANANNVVNPNSTQALTQFLGGGLTSYGLYAAAKATQAKLNTQTSSLHDYGKQIADQYQIVSEAAHTKTDNAMYGVELTNYLKGNSPENPTYGGLLSVKNWKKYVDLQTTFKLFAKGNSYTQSDSGNQFDESISGMSASLGLIDSRNLDTNSDNYPFEVLTGEQPNPDDPLGPDGKPAPITKHISEVLADNTKAITDLYSGRVGNKTEFNVLTGYKKSNEKINVGQRLTKMEIFLWTRVVPLLPQMLILIS